MVIIFDSLSNDIFLIEIRKDIKDFFNNIIFRKKGPTMKTFTQTIK